MISPPTNRQRIAIGQYPFISLIEARQKATGLLADPRAAEDGRPRKGGKQRRGTVKELFEFVIAAMKKEGKRASVADYELYLLNGTDAAAADFGPATLARNVTPDMATDWLSKFHDRGKLTRLPRAILSAAFNRGLKADNDPTTKKDRKILFALYRNPVTDVGGPTQSNIGDRSLSLGEMAQFWRDLEGDAFKGDLGDLFRMIIAMGGVRITEIVRSEKDWWRDDGEWRELNAPRLALPETKNGHPHELSVTRHGEAIMRRARDRAPAEAAHLFPSPLKPSSPRSLSALSNSIADYCTANDFDPFTPRDLRRTYRQSQRLISVQFDFLDCRRLLWTASQRLKI